MIRHSLSPYGMLRLLDVCSQIRTFTWDWGGGFQLSPVSALLFGWYFDDHSFLECKWFVSKILMGTIWKILFASLILVCLASIKGFKTHIWAMLAGDVNLILNSHKRYCRIILAYKWLLSLYFWVHKKNLTSVLGINSLLSLLKHLMFNKIELDS